MVHERLRLPEASIGESLCVGKLIFVSSLTPEHSSGECARGAFKLASFVSLILRRDQEVLLIRRSNTGYEDGLYCCAGGKIDGNEPATEALIREAREELGIILKKEHLKVVHVVHRKLKRDYDPELIGFFIEATKWEGIPQNMEPHKHDDIAWFPLHNLPENLMPTFKHVASMIENNIFYSELGWE